MRWFRKLLTLLAALVIGFSMLGAKNEDSGKKPEKSEKKKDKKGEEPDAKPEAPASEASSDSTPGKISIPVPPGHNAKGLVIPMRTPEGVMQMRFTMEIGARTDINHMDMTTLVIETFDPQGKPEMTISLPRSLLDLQTRIITTNAGVLIKRDDFEITGQSMEFNIDTKAGHLTGKVRMLIYDLENETNAKPKETSRAK